MKHDRINHLNGTFAEAGLGVSLVINLFNGRVFNRPLRNLRAVGREIIEGAVIAILGIP